MNGFDRPHAVMVMALTLAATALYLMAVAPGFRYRRVARIAARALYGATLAVVLVWIALWLLGIDPGR
jgi:hypothetical protein